MASRRVLFPAPFGPQMALVPSVKTTFSYS